MKSTIFVAAVAAFISSVTAADGVKGAAEGFAKGKSIFTKVFTTLSH
jgi:pectin lyase